MFGKQVNLNDNFKAVRVAYGKTLAYVAGNLCVSVAYANFVENGKKKPSDKYTKGFCELFGIKETQFRNKQAELKLNWR